MGAPCPDRHPSAVIGEPPEHRGFRAWIGDRFFPEVDETALIEAFVSIDSGTRARTHVGARTWLQKHVHIGHDAVIGDDCELAPGVVVCGHAVLEDGVRMGVNSSVLPFRRIGRGARIGAGAVVTHDVPPGEVWIGVPARPMPRFATAPPVGLRGPGEYEDMAAGVGAPGVS